VRRAKVDGNQADIVKALRKAGASVELLHRVGAGCPDLLVGYMGDDFLLEVKMPGEKLNDLQQSWHLQWRGKVRVVKTPGEALVAIGARMAA
jgi:hypothetical protein